MVYKLVFGTLGVPLSKNPFHKEKIPRNPNHRDPNHQFTQQSQDPELELEGESGRKFFWWIARILDPNQFI